MFSAPKPGKTASRDRFRVSGTYGADKTANVTRRGSAPDQTMESIRPNPVRQSYESVRFGWPSSIAVNQLNDTSGIKQLHRFSAPAPDHPQDTHRVIGRALSPLNR